MTSEELLALTQPGKKAITSIQKQLDSGAKFIRGAGLWSGLTIGRAVTVISKAAGEDQVYLRYDAHDDAMKFGTDTESPSLGHGTAVIIKLDSSYAHLAHPATLGALIASNEGNFSSQQILAQDVPKSAWVPEGEKPYLSLGFFFIVFLAIALASAYALYEDRHSPRCDEPLYEWLWVNFGIFAFATFVVVVSAIMYGCGKGPSQAVASFMAGHQYIKQIYVNFMILLLIALHGFYGAGGYWSFNTLNCKTVAENIHRVAIGCEIVFLTYLTLTALNAFGRAFLEWDKRNSAVYAGKHAAQKAAKYDN
eukprot:TRINITY_DN1056_c0_g1_i15.p1 TRINITY_DN1056_c0_g1~~TRINITY_DN1056_c0_g1_i15.p1  ORF type:complete len:308 (+),score=102.68 TRINITY_DN1056_c0_g1_i15:647-1570(+)